MTIVSVHYFRKLMGVQESYFSHKIFAEFSQSIISFFFLVEIALKCPGELLFVLLWDFRSPECSRRRVERE